MPESEDFYVWISLSLTLFNFKVTVFEIEEEGPNEILKVKLFKIEILV